MKLYCPCPVCRCKKLLPVRTIQYHFTRIGKKISIEEIRALQSAAEVVVQDSPERIHHQDIIDIESDADSAGSPSSHYPGDNCIQEDEHSETRMMDTEDDQNYTFARSEVCNQEAIDSEEIDESQKRDLDKPLFDDSEHTVRQTVIRYVTQFVDKSFSKQGLSDILEITADTLPKPNLLPSSYNNLIQLISPELLTITKENVCLNECVVFCGEYSKLERCPECNSNRYKEEDVMGRKLATRYFSHITIESYLSNMFGCSNIAQIMQSAGGCPSGNVDILSDIQDSSTYKDWMRDTRPGIDCKIAAGLNTDGVNPFHSHGVQYSLWPLIFVIYNLPKHLRTKPGALMLYGVIPGRRDRDGKGVEPVLKPYQNLVVEELLKLVSVEIYSAYSKAPISVQMELLVYLMDIQAYSNYFRMTGAVSYMACPICLWRGTRSKNKKKMLMLGHAAWHEKMTSRNYISEVAHREGYAGQSNATKKNTHARELGVKGCYSDMKLPYHDRVASATVDGMHTVKNVVTNIMDLILGKKNFRCPPIELTKEKLSQADSAFLQLHIPAWVDLPVQTAIISSPKAMKSHDWKQLVHHRILQFCLSNLLKKSDEKILFNLLDCLGKLYTQEVELADSDRYTQGVIDSVAAFETLCPGAMNITTHLLIHLSEQLKRFGPLHSTWLFPFERLNSWMSQKIKTRSQPEACIMETYRLFEWCSRQELDKAIQDTPSYPIISHTVDTHYSVTEQMSDAQQAQLQQLIDGMGINLTVTEQTGRIHGIVALKCQTLQDGIFSIRTTDIVESDREEFSLVLQLLAVNDPDTQRTSHFALHHMLQSITAEDDDGRFASFILSADGPSVSHVNRLSVTKPLIYSAVDGMFTIINLFPL